MERPRCRCRHISLHVWIAVHMRTCALNEDAVKLPLCCQRRHLLYQVFTQRAADAPVLHLHLHEGGVWGEVRGCMYAECRRCLPHGEVQAVQGVQEVLRIAMVQVVEYSMCVMAEAACLHVPMHMPAPAFPRVAQAWSWPPARHQC